MSEDDTSRAGTGTELFAERAIWGSRLLMLTGVVGSIAMGAIVAWVSVVDVVVLANETFGYARSPEREDVRAELISGIVKTVDGFLLAAILVIVGFGLYELFISRLDPARAGTRGPRLLLVSSIDDLKDRIAKLVVLILVIEFFQRSLKAQLSQADDLVLLAGAIVLVAAALTLPSLVKPSARVSSETAADPPSGT